MLLPHRVALTVFAAAAFTMGATVQKRTTTMTPAPPSDEQALQAYYETAAKYHPDPVPTPLDRAAAITFVNSRTNRATLPEKMRKLMRLAVFYDLHETARHFPAFCQAAKASAPISSAPHSLSSLSLGSAIPGSRRVPNSITEGCRIEPTLSWTRTPCWK